MIKLKSEQIISKILVLSFVIILITDFYYKFFRFYHLSGPKLTLIAKIIIGTIIGMYFLVNFQLEKQRRNLYTIILLLICCCITIVTYNGDNMYSSIYMMAKYFFGLIVMLFFLSNKNKIDTKYLFLVIQWVIWINSICMLLGYFNDIYIFKTYAGGRFGYCGILKNTQTASYFYILSLVLYISKKNKTLISYLTILHIIAAFFLIGSKSLYAFLFFVIIILIERNVVRYQNIVKTKQFYLLFSIAVFFVGLFFIRTFIYYNETLHNVFKKDGFWSAFFSYRNLHAKNALIDIQENYNVINILFGGISYINRITEFALVDLFLTFGIVGCLAFIYFLKYNCPKILDRQLLYFFCGVVMIIVLRGNFFYFPSVIFNSMFIFAIILKELDKNIKI